MKNGPYMPESGDPIVWFPCDDYSLNEARHEAAQHARDTEGGYAVARYAGRVTVDLWDGDGPETARPCLSWKFEIGDQAPPKPRPEPVRPPGLFDA